MAFEIRLFAFHCYCVCPQSARLYTSGKKGMPKLLSASVRMQGVYCMIMPQYFVRNAAQMCSVGRTFSFDSRADGYMRLQDAMRNSQPCVPDENHSGK